MKTSDVQTKTSNASRNVSPFFSQEKSEGLDSSKEISPDRSSFFQSPSVTQSDQAPQPVQRKSAFEGDEDASSTEQMVQRTPVSGPPDPSESSPLLFQRKPAFFEPGEAPVQMRALPGQSHTPKPFFSYPTVQPKLVVTPQNDAYEREADSVADRIVAGQSAPRITPISPGGIQQMRLDGRPVQRSSNGASMATGTAAEAIQRKGSGEPLVPEVQDQLESGTGRDLSDTRVHDDAQANDAAQSLNARAFTHGSDIWLGAGESQQDTRLMAHEATHVVQQTSPASAGSSGTIQRAPANEQPASEGEVAPGIIELKDQATFTPKQQIADWLEQRPEKTGKVRMRFGSIAEGTVKVRKSKDKYRINKQALALKHPLIQRAGENIPDGLMPSLIIWKQLDTQLGGYLSLKADARLGRSAGLDKIVKRAPDVLGLAGITLPDLPDVTNKLEGGTLTLGLSGLKFNLAGAFSGTLNLALINENVTFDGAANVSVKGLANGALTLKRNEKGLITGTVKVDVTLPKNFSGGVLVEWDGQALKGMGKVGYSGEKLSGEVTIMMMERSEALGLVKEKNAPSQAGKGPGSPSRKKPAKKSKKINYVLFGEGDLTFSFTDWLNGTAHVIVDPKGFVTIIGKITPQKEFELFPQKDYVKDLFKLEARAIYGIPVVGNLFIFANIGLNAFAKLGPAKLYKIEVAGTYSTDPDKNKNFSIKGSLNMSAAAGLRLRGEVGAGIEILGHALKAGGGINAIAGIKGYAEATPVIGYREKGAPGEDKKGEFFIKGDLEIAAQPFFGLGGDLFVEVDSPWWSPLPDKKWTWPLGQKEWPLGGTFGFGARVEYVFGSGKPPEITFPPVEFDPDKFTTDLVNDKTASKKPQKPKEGKWNEKNSKDAPPPSKSGSPGSGVSLEKGKAPTANKPSVSKEKKNPPKPDAKTAEGKTVKQLKDEAEKGKKGEVKDPKGTKSEKTELKSDEKTTQDKDVITTATETFKSKDGEKHRLYFKGKGENAILMVASNPKGLKQLLIERIAGETDPKKKAALENALSLKKALDKYLRKHLKTQKKNERTTQNVKTELEAKLDEIAKQLIIGGMDGADELPLSKVTYSINDGRAYKVVANPLSKLPGNTRGTVPSTNPLGWDRVRKMDSSEKSRWVRLHMLNHNLHGPGHKWNLAPGTKEVNSEMEKEVEGKAKALVDNNKVLYYEVQVSYHQEKVDQNFPREIDITWGQMEKKGAKWEKNKSTEIFKPFYQAPPKEALNQVPGINESSASRLRKAVPGVPWDDIVRVRREKGRFENSNDLASSMNEYFKSQGKPDKHFSKYLKTIAKARMAGEIILFEKTNAKI